MTNDRDIKRYDVTEHGELPLSYGRYVHYDDYEDAVQELLRKIEGLEAKLDAAKDDYSKGYDDGYSDCQGSYE